VSSEVKAWLRTVERDPATALFLFPFELTDVNFDSRLSISSSGNIFIAKEPFYFIKDIPLVLFAFSSSIPMTT
jgi:hypothetical protein